MAANLVPRPNSGGTERTQKASYVLSLVLKLAAAMNVELSKATLAVYLEQLSKFSYEALSAGIDRTIKAWDKPHMVPPIAYIIARIREHFEDIQRKQIERRSRELLTRPAIHPDFQHSSESQRRLEFQRIVLESKASGVWGDDAVAPAKAGLTALGRGENTQEPGDLHEAICAASNGGRLRLS